MEYKLYIFLFVLFIFIQSNIFKEGILLKMNGAIEGEHVTQYGTIIQGIILTISFIIISVLIDNDYI
jgi:hypothetical protein